MEGANESEHYPYSPMHKRRKDCVTFLMEWIGIGSFPYLFPLRPKNLKHSCYLIKHNTYYYPRSLVFYFRSHKLNRIILFSFFELILGFQFYLSYQSNTIDIYILYPSIAVMIPQDRV